MKDQIKNILLAFTRKHRIAPSSVVLELFAEELIRHGVVIPVRCANCKHRTAEGFCYKDVEGVSYKKTHEKGYCDKGEPK